MIMNDELEGSDCGLILRYYPTIFLEELIKTTKNLKITGLRAEM
jgi:hypothetical protein